MKLHEAVCIQSPMQFSLSTCCFPSIYREKDHCKREIKYNCVSSHILVLDV